ncbi:MAG TPA: alginate export family protein [Luteitalea sp.]|nr:alginate export family protein [Luteitalea sp.]
MIRTPPRFACRGVLLRSALAALALGVVPPARAQAPPAPATPSGFTLHLRDTTRAEAWRFFEPPPGGGDPTYGYVANRLQLEVRRAWRRVDLQMTAQHVGFAGVPSRASGPGPLGLGALYFDQGGRRTSPQQLWLRYANVRVKQVLPGLDVTIGRMPYTSGAEAPSGDARIEALKRQRLDARIVGEFEWSIYQRGFDGVRADWTRGPVKATGIAFRPTQGGFARVAGPTIDDVSVAGATISLQPTPRLRHTQVQGFVLRYDDQRRVTQRPDNSGQAAAAVDIGITSYGATAVGSYPMGAGAADLLAWGVLQRGNWYGQVHRGTAVAVEGGYQWLKVPWAPWLRAGVIHTSGDESVNDATHGTYFPVLPTVRRFSQTTMFSTMNVDDAFVQVLARPHRRVGTRLDVHALRLASAADLWYIGSGATLEEGAAFGYSGRRSNGSRALGTSVEASADVTLTPVWSVNTFVGHVRGGPVVTGTFAGRDFWFAYVEQVVRLDDLFKRRR